MAPAPDPTVNEIPREAFDELATSVATLTQSVEGMREGTVDRETVENIVKDIVAQQAAAAPRGGYRPSDDELEAGQRELHGKTGTARLNLIQSMHPKKVQMLTKINSEQVADLHQAADRAVLLSAILQMPIRELAWFASELEPRVQALTTGGSGTGEEWVPTQLSPDLIDRVELQRKVLSLFQSIEMPTNPFNIPGRSLTRLRLAKGTEQSGDTGQTGFKKVDIASRQVQMNAKKFDGEALVSKEEEEDAIIAVLPLMEDELSRYLAYDMEDAAVNGDTAGTQDSDFASDDPRKNWDGLRKLALASASTKSDFAGAALTVAGIRALRKKMGKYGVDPAQLAHIFSINEYIDILNDTAVLTLEKYGPDATVLTGELGKVDNIPIIVSEAMRTDLNVSGVFDGTTETRTSGITVYRPGFATGSRRELTIQVLRELYAEYDQDAVLISIRRAFVSLYSGDPTVAILYDVNK